MADPAAPPREPSAFLVREEPPTDDALSGALGPAAPRWATLRASLAVAYPPVDETWAYSGRKLGWALRVRRIDRPIAYLTPLHGAFRASLALPERVVAAALASGLADDLRALVADAPSAAEGRAIRIEVRSDADVGAVLALARLRMAS